MAFAFDSTNPKIIYAGSDGVIYKSLFCKEGVVGLISQ
jgi:hypothetical protein